MDRLRDEEAREVAPVCRGRAAALLSSEGSRSIVEAYGIVMVR